MMRNFKKWASLTVIFSMAFSNISCTTMKPIDSITEPDQIVRQIKAGDVIRYQTGTGKIERLIVTSVNGETIQGISHRQDKKDSLIRG